MFVNNLLVVYDIQGHFIMSVGLTVGFRTCFANPMPASICTPRTVCGTARCDISLHGSLYAIKCDRRCKDRQSVSVNK